MDSLLSVNGFCQREDARAHLEPGAVPSRRHLISNRRRSRFHEETRSCRPLRRTRRHRRPSAPEVPVDRLQDVLDARTRQGADESMWMAPASVASLMFRVSTARSLKTLPCTDVLDRVPQSLVARDAHDDRRGRARQKSSAGHSVNFTKFTGMPPSRPARTSSAHPAVCSGAVASHSATARHSTRLDMAEQEARPLATTSLQDHGDFLGNLHFWHSDRARTERMCACAHFNEAVRTRACAGRSSDATQIREGICEWMLAGVLLLEPPRWVPVTRILLAEDEAALRRMIARVLRANGYDVVEAADGEDAMVSGIVTPTGSTCL